MARDLKTVITRDQAIARFMESHVPGILEAERKYDHVGGPDLPMRREAWNNYVDALRANREISDWQQAWWNHPPFSDGENPKSVPKIFFA
jgi:hypothetical protein